ncbi:MAG: diguanylate cyclase [Gammaproteobacteria bacterium]|nr:diguanylate cyclase [Gammaproteobacteria bacterium]MBU2058789.1 diguanylate cyclase [Gammaproteobacteria bacterium]MBU2177148.1 diguanylate cyclase [Gammaproteobacteria bacterium]MBU2247134.1 diguanylate cyclase [Gammaproteobacteria bacterium]MBU2343626.1 diguanylate cyclase [Gammaproteobacteria bacterium]
MPSPSLASLSDYIDQLLEAICVVDANGRFLYLSSGCERIFGYKSAEMIGRPMIELVHPQDRERTLLAASEIMAGDQKIDFENRYIRRDGQIAYIQWSARWSEDQKVRVAVARDITKHKQLLEQLQHIAFYDPLTQLPNRALFEDRLQQSLARARREQGMLALCFVDLDKFKEVNDQLGHAAGDLCLKKVAELLLFSVRETDTVARLGGDEFVIVMDAVTDQAAVLSALQSLQTKLRQPFLFEQHPLQLSASIGIAFFPQHGQDQSSLLAAADRAMYRAKHAGGNQLWCATELLDSAGKNFG